MKLNFNTIVTGIIVFVSASFLIDWLKKNWGDIKTIWSSDAGASGVTGDINVDTDAGAAEEYTERKRRPQ